MDTFSQLDAQLLLFFNSHHTAFLDDFWMLFTGRYIWVPMYVALLAAVARDNGWRRTVVVALFIALAITATDQFCGNLLRHSIERMRPSNPDNPLSLLVQTVDGYRGGKYGFPSCHAANSFALASFCALLFRSRRAAAFLFLWAVCNSYSRLYLGVHYPGDILVGSILGFTIGGICCAACDMLAPPAPEAAAPGRIRSSDLPIAVGLASVIAIALASLQ